MHTANFSPEVQTSLTQAQAQVGSNVATPMSPCARLQNLFSINVHMLQPPSSLDDYEILLTMNMGPYQVRKQAYNMEVYKMASYDLHGGR